VNEIDSRLGATGYHFQDLVLDIVHSVPFQQRRAEVDTTSTQPKSKELARR
jgi:hypothetical protein